MFAFKVKDGPDGTEATWIVDVKTGKGFVSNDPGMNKRYFIYSELGQKNGSSLTRHP